MDPIAFKVAAVILAKDYFHVTDTLTALRGETIDADKTKAYEVFLRDTAEAYKKKSDELGGQKTPGNSNPKAGELGKELQKLRKKGTKARARLQVAEWLKKKGLKSLTVSPTASGEPEDMTVLKNPLQDLKGETIEAGKLKEYESAFKQAKESYAKKKAENKDQSGAARGRGGQELAALGKEMRTAEVRVQAAKELAKRGLTKAVF